MEDTNKTNLVMQLVKKSPLSNSL